MPGLRRTAIEHRKLRHSGCVRVEAELELLCSPRLASELLASSVGLAGRKPFQDESTIHLNFSRDLVGAISVGKIPYGAAQPSFRRAKPVPGPHEAGDDP